MMRTILAIAILCGFAVAPSLLLAQTLSPDGSITAEFVVAELKALGYAGTIDTDDSGDPRVTTKVDGYQWQVYFYSCNAGSAAATRGCQSYQFFSGYTTAKPVPLDTINQWNNTQRYLKANRYTQRDGRSSARVEIDVMAAGTGAERSATFRIHFDKMKDGTERFRKHINFGG
jgi:hypothetical protein